MNEICNEKINTLKKAGKILYELGNRWDIDDELHKNIVNTYYTLGKIVEKIKQKANL